MSKFQKGDKVDVVASVDDFVPYDWTGTVVGYHGEYVMVRDFEDNVFDCSEEQLTLVED